MWAEKDNEVAYEVSAELDVSGTPAKVLTGFTYTGSLDDSLQTTGSAPNLTGLTFKAQYSDGTEATIDSSNVVVSPTEWDASGNPENLASQTATFSYTEGGVTETDTASVVVHRPIASFLDITNRGVVYFDYTQDLLNLTREQDQGGTYIEHMAGPAFLINPQIPTPQAGDMFMGVFLDNDTTVDAAKLQEYYAKFRPNMMAESTGTPNTPGYFPKFGNRASVTATQSGVVDTACYIAASFEGKPEPSDPYYAAWAGPGTYTTTIVIGKLVNNLSTSYSLSDFDDEGKIVYQVVCGITE